MTQDESERPQVQFVLDPNSAGKRPEQLVALLERVLRTDFPEVADVVQVSHGSGHGEIALLNLDAVDPETAEKLARRARVVYNEFMISPWY